MTDRSLDSFLVTIANWTFDFSLDFGWEIFGGGFGYRRRVGIWTIIVSSYIDSVARPWNCLGVQNLSLVSRAIKFIQ